MCGSTPDALPTKSMILPGFCGLMWGRYLACGSNMTILVPLTKKGTSVTWYTALKPTPKRPVLPGSSFLRESPMRWIDAKSRSVNTASL